jgi:uncharacterized protein
LIKKKNIEFVICTNLTMITDDILRYFSEKNIFISTSLDGPSHIHNNNRIYRSGLGCYDDVVMGIDKARKHIGPDNISALMTTTRYSLAFPKEIVDEYIRNGFSSIFVRSLNPFGYANEKINLLGYSPWEFVIFYKKILDYIVKINMEGIFLKEYFATLLLTRILTPFSTGFVDLQFPAGTGILGVVYAHDGNVYPSDEARMLAQVGNNTFCMGNLYKNNYQELFYNEKLRNLINCSCVEGLPGCSACAYQIYCGVDPVRNYATQQDTVGHRPTNATCIINKEIIKYLFKMILENDQNIMDVFWSWITNKQLKDIQG